MSRQERAPSPKDSWWPADQMTAADTLSTKGAYSLLAVRKLRSEEALCYEAESG